MVNATGVELFCCWICDCVLSNVLRLNSSHLGDAFAVSVFFVVGGAACDTLFKMLVLMFSLPLTDVPFVYDVGVCAELDIAELFVLVEVVESEEAAVAAAVVVVVC